MNRGSLYLPGVANVGTAYMPPGLSEPAAQLLFSERRSSYPCICVL